MSATSGPRLINVFVVEGDMRLHPSRQGSIRHTLAWLTLLAACSEHPTAPMRADPVVVTSARQSEREGTDDRNRSVRCDADNAGITLPPGFCALVVADLVEDGHPAQARHIAITP